MPEPVTTTSLHISDQAIADLCESLARTRFPDPAPGAAWSYGADIEYIRQLVEYWRSGFDWRAQEARLNALPQYTTALFDIDLHFLHVPGRGPAPTPLLLLHGWPGSVFEFLEIIPRLTDPARFAAIRPTPLQSWRRHCRATACRSKPGQRRFGVEEIADCVAALMQDALGYSKFAVQGGDWGAITASRLGYAHPEKLIGIHINLLAVRRERDKTAAAATPEEERYYDELAVWLREETGYSTIQGTKPQTLAFGLTNSPAGLAAWIVEKFRSWSDCGGDVESVFTRDQLLANISFYWFTGAIGSSFFPYFFRLHRPWPIPEGCTIDVPTGYAEFPREILRPPRSVAARTYRDLRRWTTMPRGGHFAAMEQPEALAREVQEFFRPLRG